MGSHYQSLRDDLVEFISEQKIFFVGTAANEGTINVSPKGWESLRILNTNRIVWRNVTGSGNETAAHLAENNRMTLMFCAFTGKPKILRLYGQATAYHQRDAEFAELDKLFDPHLGSRQLVDFRFDLVQTSCGFGVPLYDFREERDNMDKWLASKTRDEITDYWSRKNSFSLDGKPTYILEEKNE
ncbi:MAG: pyridoxamine 5'-phosphate oxidase family protein [Gammaproteobacteria bacterium]|nr:pyridoxamine 5'-phosphate oxidase family protein [Gammaproteobacteria bacterium]MCY4357924.1 pyridoxamine 5'-phosphate oxidase family protein [Gammaproteobacteria bacterium]